MQKRILVVLLCFVIGFLPISSYSQSISYKFIMELGKRSLSQTFYEEAIHYFNIAHQVSPALEEPLFYIDFAKRLKEGRIEKALTICDEKSKKRFKSKKKIYKVKENKSLISDTLDFFESRSKQVFKKNDEFIRKLIIHEALSLIETKDEKLVMKGVQKDKGKKDKTKIRKLKDSADKPKSFKRQLIPKKKGISSRYKENL